MTVIVPHAISTNATRPLTLLFICAALTAIAGEPDTQWTGYLGPRRDGVTTMAIQPPAAWPKKLTEVWKVSVGDGYSSAVFDGKMIYLQYRTETQELLGAFDAATGKQQWEQKLDPCKEPMPHEPAPTPELHAGALYVHSLSGAVFKLDTAAAGKIIWRRDLPGEWKGEKYRQLYGVAASPLIVGETLALPTGDKETGKALVLKLSDGSTAWETPTTMPGYSSFVPMKLGGEDCLVTLLFEGAAVFKKNAAGFALGFTHELAGGADGNSTTPIAIGADRFLITGHESTIALRAASGATKCEEVWKIEQAGNLSTPLFTSGRIYLFDERDLRCIDPANGKSLSRIEMSAQFCTLLAWGGVLICRLHEGSLKFVDISNVEMKLLADYPAAEEEKQSWCAPIPISPTRMVMRTGDKLMCLTWEKQ